MERKEKSNEIVITTRKIVDNIKRFWWIIVVAIIVGCILIGIGVNKNATQSAGSLRVEEILYVQSTEGEEQELENGMDQYTAAFQDNSAYINGTSIGEMVGMLAQTKSIQDEVNKKLIEKGYSEFQSGSDEISFTRETRLLICSVRGENLERTVCLINVYTEAIANQINPLLKGQQVVVTKKAEVADYKNEIASAISSENVFSVKNFFIMCLCVGTGFLAIFICILFDKRIRAVNEVLNIHSCLYLGSIKSGKREKVTLDQIKTIVSYKLLEENTPNYLVACVCGKRIKVNLVRDLVVAIGKEINYQADTVAQLCECKGKSNDLPTLAYASNMDDDAQVLSAATQVNGVILVISTNDDTIQAVDRAFTGLLAMRKNILGFILVD